MNEFRFMKFFKKATRMTFVTYLTHLGLSCAHRLLEETHRSIVDIAATVGFTDQSYFDRRFRQLYGRTPREVWNGGDIAQVNGRSFYWDAFPPADAAWRNSIRTHECAT